MKNPKLISKPFAQNGQKNVIPEKYETSMESNQATWDQGFGQITMLPVSAGGLPPKGQDFNGILNQMCETIVHISKGGAFKFSADYATAINGYPKGAILQSEDEKKYYQSIIDNNKVNFNTASQDQIKTSWKLVMTDDLLDQLSKKLESSAVVQSTGTSTTSVMSQKASTDVFQPKGDYALKSSKDHFQSGEHKITGNFATLVLETADGASCFLEKKNNSPTPYFVNRDASGVTTSTIDIPNESGTLALLSDLDKELKNYQPKGDYATAGSSYTKAESDGRYQGKGNYQPAGNYALVGVSYTKAESDGKYQPKGNYALKSSKDHFQSGEHKITGNFATLVLETADGASCFLEKKNNSPTPYFVNRDASGVTTSTIDIPNESGTLALLSDLEEVNNIPVGSPIPWSLATAPSGYLICQGQTFNKATYPKLAIAYPSGRLPELRSEFIRGADAGRGIDTGREVLSSQSGNSLLSARGVGGNSEFSLKMSSGSIGTDNQGQREIYQQIEDKNGNETRPRNIAFLYIVRAA
ncbi:phage tail protein [Proteus mirabilis]|uniref:phage tail protein n=1 Tax=Proteus mirabilis TaxID=584 RepID=UPI0020C78595|nr:phage tail protein [Proteus mirabilis]